MKIKGVDFPAGLLNALRDERPVVFAGAGVSMGVPAGLPSFRKLAERVAEGTSQSIAESEADDQFLEPLQGCKGEDSHQLAAKLPCANNSAPAPVYQGLLQFFPATDPGRSSPPVSTACLRRKRRRSKMNQPVHTPYTPPRRPQRCKQYHRQP